MLSEIAKAFGSLSLEARTELIQEWAKEYFSEGVDYIVLSSQELAFSLTGIEKISRMVDRPAVYESAKHAFKSLEGKRC